MLESIKKVESTRKSRVESQPKKLTEQEKQAILKEFHPDYREDAFEILKAGPNKGQKAPKEVATILHSGSKLSDINLDLNNPDYDVDVLVLGGGGAGASAAIEAKKAGATTLLATKLRMGDSNTVMAETGIQAATSEGDSPQQHYLDAFVIGKYAAKPKVLSRFCLDAPGIIKWLENLGVSFSKALDGSLITAHGVSTSRKRLHISSLFTGGHSIGVEIIRVLKDELHNLKIPILEYMPAVELIKDNNGNISGAVLVNILNGQLVVVKSKSVIIATGGSGRLHHSGLITNNHYGSTADGLVLAYRAGANLIDQDTHQYTATGVAWPTAVLGVRLIDVFRTIGAGLCNIDGEQFINSTDERDVVGAAIIRECTQKGKGIKTLHGNGVWLDFPMLDLTHGKGFTEKTVKGLYLKFKKLGIDITNYPILVYPISDYQNGGIEIEEDASTKALPNLFAAGEVSGGIHGRDRNPGNSLMDMLVFGRIAGKKASKISRNIVIGEPNLDHVKSYTNELLSSGFDTNIKSPILLPNYANDSNHLKAV